MLLVDFKKGCCLGSFRLSYSFFVTFDLPPRNLEDSDMHSEVLMRSRILVESVYTRKSNVLFKNTFMCMEGCMHVWRLKNTFWESILSTVWVPWIKLRISGLVASTFTW